MDSSSKRKSLDITKLMMSDYAVELVNDGDSEFIVDFQGPKGSLYEGGVWKVQVQLPDDYPYKPPVVEFKNKIFHPNIDDLSGNVCVDVLDENWSPIYDLVKVFEDFLPQLLRDPNPSDPLNLDAAAFMLEDEKLYEEKVKEYCELYAKEINVPQVENESSNDKTSDGQCTSSDEDFPGDADP